MCRYFFLIFLLFSFRWSKLAMVFVVCFLLCFSSGKSQLLVNEFQITGTTLIKNKDIVYISYYSNIKQKGIDDSCKITDGNFFLKGMISQPAVAFISLNRDKIIDDQTAVIFIEPSVIKIRLLTNPFAVEVLSGSKTNLEYDSLQRKKNLLEEKYKTIIAEKKHNENNDELEKKLKPYYEALQQLDFAFFSAHPQSFATAYLLQFYHRTLDADTLQLYYNAMSTILKESIYGEQLKGDIKRKKSVRYGRNAANFSSATNTNRIISLSDFKGRYVLLDFWAHWCVPCRENFPNLIKQYNTYHDKGLEIIGVADDDFSQDQWKKAIENDKVGIWYQILRGLKKNKGGEVDKVGSINEMYNINLLPTKILIDQSGIIIGTYVGTEAEEKLEKKLQKIFE